MADAPRHPSLAGVSLDDTRAMVRAFLDDHREHRLRGREWQQIVVDSGWAAPTWKHPLFGRSASGAQAKVIAEEFDRVAAKGAGQDRHNLWANTLLAYGSLELQGTILRGLLLDEVSMCLLYSEPGAGSDLAAVQTRADRDGDEWIVNGQKVWTSGAKTADYGMLIARTNWDVPKHAGITFFFLPMRQAGIEIRPIRQITDESHFNEVFITDARVPDRNRLGAEGEGWKVLQTALAYERSLMGDLARGPGQPGVGEKAGGEDADIPTEDRARPVPVSAVDIDLWALARAHGVADDPVIRQRIAHVHSLRMVNVWNAMRAKATLGQGTSSPILSLGKLAMSTILHVGAKVQGEIIGAEAMLTGPGHQAGADANFLALNAYFTSIGGGTDQIQRNIIGERVLGLPKEPENDRDVPFSQVRRAVVGDRR